MCASLFSHCMLSKSFISKCHTLHARMELAIYSPSELLTISNISSENKIRGKMPSTVTHSTSIPVCVCVCDWRHSMKEQNRGQVNNGLLTATLLPVICMQRSAEVNVQKDTNSTIVSTRPDNLLNDQTATFVWHGKSRTRWCTHEPSKLLIAILDYNWRKCLCSAAATFEKL